LLVEIENLRHALYSQDEGWRTKYNVLISEIHQMGEWKIKFSNMESENLYLRNEVER